MTIRTTLIASSLIAASLVSGAAQAALQGRYLTGSSGSFEAYYDTDLDITWLADANYAWTSDYDYNGAMNWATATTWAANLSFTDGVNVYDNWRLPTVDPINGTSFNYKYSYDGSTDVGYNISEQGTAFAGSTASEMAHLFYNTLDNRSYYMNPSYSWGLTNVGPFSNLQASFYWSATEYSPETYDTYDAWQFGMNIGVQAKGFKPNHSYAWAVSSGDVGAVPEAQTYALMLAGLGLIGWRVRRRG